MSTVQDRTVTNVPLSRFIGGLETKFNHPRKALDLLYFPYLLAYGIRRPSRTEYGPLADVIQAKIRRSTEYQIHMHPLFCGFLNIFIVIA